jgi:hypothetical protein
VNPSPAAIAAIQAKVTDWTATDNAIAVLLDTPSIVNPATQATVAAPVAPSTVLNLVSSGSLAKILSLPSFDATILPLLNQPDPKPSASFSTLNLWAAGLFKGGYLTQSEFDALAAPTSGTTPSTPAGLFNQTQLDPSYQPQISWAQATLGRPVDAADIAAARPA